MITVAIISDTHGLLRPEVIEELKKADAIIHAGDINTQQIVDEMKQYAPLYIVRGNNDKEWAQELPLQLSVTLEGLRFYIVHNKKDIDVPIPEVDIIVYGHSHKYAKDRINGICYLNPGSCGKRRFHQEITMCRLTIKENQYEIEKLVFPQ